MKCPNCGAILKQNENGYRCRYCGYVEEKINDINNNSEKEKFITHDVEAEVEEDELVEDETEEVEDEENSNKVLSDGAGKVKTKNVKHKNGQYKKKQNTNEKRIDVGDNLMKVIIVCALLFVSLFMLFIGYIDFGY